MSLTSHITNRSEIYEAILSVVDLDRCEELIRHQAARLSCVVHRPPQGTDFPLAGMSVIYAVRDHIGGSLLWEKTIAGRGYPYPQKIPTPARWVAMGMMDQSVRTGRNSGLTVRSCLGGLPPHLQPTVDDVAAIAASIPSMIPKGPMGAIYLNPTFSGSSDVGGADANMITGSTLWDIRTTAKRNPLTLDHIIQQVGYCLLDYYGKYQIQEIAWYYTRQQCLFTHPVEALVKRGALNQFEDLLLEASYV